MPRHRDKVTPYAVRKWGEVSKTERKEFAARLRAKTGEELMTAPATKSTSVDDVDEFEYRLCREVKYHREQLAKLLDSISRRAAEDAQRVQGGDLPMYGASYFLNQANEVAEHHTTIKVAAEALLYYRAQKNLGGIK